LQLAKDLEVFAVDLGVGASDLEVCAPDPGILTGDLDANAGDLAFAAFDPNAADLIFLTPRLQSVSS
jgi:hypothetical protein